MGTSPFHAGEQALQSRLGVRDRMEQAARRMMHTALPDQHREFYAQLPFVVLGSYDPSGSPWASIVTGRPGFVSSPVPERLVIASEPILDDPLREAWHSGQRLGVLGIQPETRRRNRASGRVLEVSESGLQLQVEQAFGNCPKYISTRRALPVPSSPTAQFSPVCGLSGVVAEIIGASDTFFVASYVAKGDGTSSDGVDVSHRGGAPGFVHIDDERRLTVPDYRGNSMFNTLGNFVVNPKAGLLFVDFASGDIVTLTGTVEIQWDQAKAAAFEGAQRLWQFTLDHGRYLPGALPLRWEHVG